MDGTLVDSIAAVEAAWTSVADELGLDADEVIAATHGRRGIDNLRELNPKLRRMTNEQMEPYVEDFEKRILKEADEFSEKVKSRRSSTSSSRRGSTAHSRRASSGAGPNPLLSGLAGGKFGLSKMTDAKTSSGNRTGSHSGADSGEGNPPAPGQELDGLDEKLAGLSTDAPPPLNRTSTLDNPFDSDSDDEDDDYTEEEIGCPDRSVRILPGVKRLIDSLPKSKYAIATSGAKTYCHGALYRAGIKRPNVTITADDPRLKNGKPFPDPFLLAAKELGIPIDKCLVFEDSPSGIKAGVSSGAKTIAICTSHPVEKINTHGAHYIVPSLDCVHAFPQPDGRIKIVIDAHPPTHPRHGSRGSFVAVAPDWDKKSFSSTPAPSSHLNQVTV